MAYEILIPGLSAMVFPSIQYPIPSEVARVAPVIWLFLIVIVPPAVIAPVAAQLPSLFSPPVGFWSMLIPPYQLLERLTLMILFSTSKFALPPKLIAVFPISVTVTPVMVSPTALLLLIP